MSHAIYYFDEFDDVSLTDMIFCFWKDLLCNHANGEACKDGTCRDRWWIIIFCHIPALVLSWEKVVNDVTILLIVCFSCHVMMCWLCLLPRWVYQAAAPVRPVCCRCSSSPTHQKGARLRTLNRWASDICGITVTQYSHTSGSNLIFNKHCQW